MARVVVAEEPVEKLEGFERIRAGCDAAFLCVDQALSRLPLDFDTWTL